MMTRRYFYKCRDKTCKHKWAVDVEGETPASYTIIGHSQIARRAYALAGTMACPLCGRQPHAEAFQTHHDVMGFVREARPWDLEERRRLVDEGQAVPCDARCTNARGPSCDCVCGGKNHGTRAVITVQRDAGPVPKEDKDMGNVYDLRDEPMFTGTPDDGFDAGDFVGSCPMCGGEGVALGSLGHLEWLRCRACGWTFYQEVRHDAS